jgi:hypothetical protein
MQRGEKDVLFDPHPMMDEQLLWTPRERRHSKSPYDKIRDHFKAISFSVFTLGGASVYQFEPDEHCSHRHEQGQHMMACRRHSRALAQAINKPG